MPFSLYFVRKKSVFLRLNLQEKTCTETLIKLEFILNVKKYISMKKRIFGVNRFVDGFTFPLKIQR